MGPVDFVRGMEEALIRLCGGFGVRAGRIAGLTGVWCGAAGLESGGAGDAGELLEERGGAEPERKIAAIGIHVARGITSHGFAFNVTTDLSDFELIIPCGIADHPVTSLEREMQRQKTRNPQQLPALEAIADQAARNFGQVFDEQVLGVESLAALRAPAAALAPPQPPPQPPVPAQFSAPVQFPAEDTPLQVPPEVKRLRGQAEGPVRA
jgi:lipoyl(octanoyl) transferase